MRNSSLHIPVLLDNVIESLNIKTNGIYIDCTAGRGGHSEKILKHLTSGKIICVDCDAEAIDYLKKYFKNKKNVYIVKDNFINIKKILEQFKITHVDGILADLGVSSPMFDNIERGFSYHNDGIIDMRMDREQEVSAINIINEYSFAQLCKIFREYGEVSHPNFVANKIIATRNDHKITSTKELVDLIKSCVPYKKLNSAKHPAKQYFQSLRIATNDELNNLVKFIDEACKLLNNDGRLSIITFNSLEDRIVKHAFRDLTTSKIPHYLPITEKINYSLLNNKPIIASEKEIITNKRARSAKLRTIIYHD